MGARPSGRAAGRDRSPRRTEPNPSVALRILLFSPATRFAISFPQVRRPPDPVLHHVSHLDSRQRYCFVPPSHLSRAALTYKTKGGPSGIRTPVLLIC